MDTIAVIGAGAWGTALAAAARRAGRTVVLWAREPEVVEQITEAHENRAFLPGIGLDPGIRATGDLAAAAAAGEALVLAVPAQHLRATAEHLARLGGPPRPLVVASKGIEAATLKLMTEVLAEVAPAWPAAVLSGPTFAGEVARGRPTAATLAATDAALGGRLAAALGSRTFRPYLGDDPAGAQIGGAVKNVVAIACGIVAGRGLGENARAALITRALAEIVRLAEAKGARAETLHGLSGLGDLILTCTSPASRNYSLGIALGEGRAKDSVLGERRSIAEGVFSAAAVRALADSLGVDMPIAAAVDAVLNRAADIDRSISDLLARPLRPEQG